MKYLGIDGGGTKTKFVLYDENGNNIKETQTTTIHVFQSEEQQCIDILQKGVNELLTDVDEDVLIIAGLAGYGQEQHIRNKIHTICEQAFDGYLYHIYNDVQIAIAGALSNNDGIVIIAGTGSIVLSSINTEQRRCGGFGYHLGDEGSAYWIGKKVLSVYCKQVDGRLEKTRIYNQVKETLNLTNDYDIISYINNPVNNTRDKVAQLAMVAYKCALEEDAHAINIYKEAAQELAEMVKVLATDFNNTITISYIGGVFRAGELILTPLREALQGIDCNIVEPHSAPEYGAYLLGREK